MRKEQDFKWPNKLRLAMIQHYERTAGRGECRSGYAGAGGVPIPSETFLVLSSRPADTPDFSGQSWGNHRG